MLAINTIVVPQGAEYQAVCRGLQQTKMDDIEVIAIPIGVKFVDRVLSDYENKLDRATGVLIVGLCGSLSNFYSIGDLVLVTACKDLNHNIVHLNNRLVAEIQHKLAVATAMGLTSDRVITQAPKKLALAQKYNAAIVEMEGYDYVTKLQQREIPVAMLRVVSDDIYGDIPDLSRAIDPQGNLQTLPMAIAFLKQPIAAVRLIKGSLTGLKALSQTTAKLFSG